MDDSRSIPASKVMKKLLNNEILSVSDKIFLREVLSASNNSISHFLPQDQQKALPNVKGKNKRGHTSDLNELPSQSLCSSSNKTHQKKKKMRHTRVQTDEIKTPTIEIKKTVKEQKIDAGTQIKFVKHIQKVKNASVQSDLPTNEVMSKYLYDAYTLSPEITNQKKFATYYRELFYDRRAFILSKELPKASLIKEFYPYLFDKAQMFTEFELLTEKKNLFQIFSMNVKKYSSGVLKFAPRTADEKKIFKQMNIFDSEVKEWIQDAMSLILFPKCLGEKRNGLIIFADEVLPNEHSSRPYIKYNGNLQSSLMKSVSLELYIDDLLLCKVSNLLEAFFVLIAAYHIFDAEYPRDCKKTITCFDKIYTEYGGYWQVLNKRTATLLTFLHEYSNENEECDS